VTRWLALVVLLCCGGAVAGADLAGLEQAAADVGDGSRIVALDGELRQALDRAPETLAPPDYLSAAEVLGKLVSRARELGVDARVFERLTTTAALLSERCRDKVRALESTTGEDEIALESLYRSDTWYDINHAQSAFGYWRAWAMLGLAESRPEARERVKWLNRAETGFKTASVRILYPGIVQGSWLGLGYIAQARGDSAGAEQRFRRLVAALADRPENPVRKLAESELTLLAVRRGEIRQLTAVSREPLSPTLAAVVAEEAFALLERRRQENIGAMDAGQRLRKLIADGFLTDSLLARILAYRDEIVGEDLGVLSRLIDAEYAYAYEQYKTTVIKYREFREQGGEQLPIDTSPFHYHYIVALVSTDLPREASAEVERLKRRPNLHPSVAAALPKLGWSVAAVVYAQHPTEANRERLERLAGAFVAAAPRDADVATAHLGLARLSEDPAVAARHLRAARANPELRGDIALTALHRDISRFNRAAARWDAAAQAAVARDILTALDDLPGKQRREPWFRALSLQMRTVLERDLAKVLAEADALLAEAATDTRVRPVLLWSKLRALAATDDRAGLLAMADVIAAQGNDTEGERQFYQFLLELERRENFELVAGLAEHFYPALVGQGQDQRQVSLLRIRMLAALGRRDEGFELARAMVREFPDSGDGWQAYAELAERSDRAFEADRAWAKIAAATPEGSPRWRDAMLRRLALNEADTDTCPLADKLAIYRHLLNSEQAQALALARKQRLCGS
jgi:Tfp pilus assembly protein PilF